MKEREQARILELDHPPSLNPMRSITVAIVVSLAFVAAVYLAIG